MMIMRGAFSFLARVALGTLISAFQNSRYFPNEISIAV
jgi:hypothetical protein